MHITSATYKTFTAGQARDHPYIRPESEASFSFILVLSLFNCYYSKFGEMLLLVLARQMERSYVGLLTFMLLFT
jgi:hypothetical protein